MKNCRYFNLLLVLALIFTACNREKDVEADSVVDLPEPKKLYGIIVDSLEVVEDKIKNGQNLSLLLNSQGISGLQIQQLVDAGKGVFDARSIRVGKAYTLIRDSSRLLYWVYEHDPITYFVADFTDSLPTIKKHERPVSIVQKKLGGVISSSLFKTVLDSGGSQEVAVSLAGVFDWTVDFFSVQKGDFFRVIYEEKQVEGKPYGMGRILAAEFNHRGKNNVAILFDNGKPMQYYNEKGESMRKRYLKAPLEFSRISSRFSLKRFHPVLKRYKAHLGTDYAAPTGTPIRSIGDGTVVEAGYRGGNGNFVKIKHNRTHTTGYLHMSKIASGIRSGARVSQGQVIGYVGSTGLATGPHLCFRFWENEVQVDPRRIQTPPADPLPDAMRPAFYVVRDSMLKSLSTVAVGLEE
jgi:murein DD-endopeptidase MepM/ murein hydrolase activator NlpD